MTKAPMDFSCSRLTFRANATIRAKPHEVSEDRTYYGNTDDGSWLCTRNDIDDITADVNHQHHNGQPISPAASPPHNPTALKMQAMQTAIISTMAEEPIRLNPACALGLRCQIGSRKLPGNNRATAERKLAHVPMEKSIISAITPNGRALVINFLYRFGGS